MFTEGTDEIETFWVRVSVVWCAVVLLLVCGWLRVQYMRRKILKQISDNARAYIWIHSHICPLQRRVHKMHLARAKTEKEANYGTSGGSNSSAEGGGVVSADAGTPLLTHASDGEEDEHDGHWQLASQKNQPGSA